MPIRSQFDSLVRKEAGYVQASLRRLGVQERDLDDLSQDVFVAVHGRFSDFDPERAPRPWLFAFAFRAAANYRRLARHHREQSHPSEPANPADQESRLLAQEQQTLLTHALAQLDLVHRAAVVLVDIDGVSPKDAADALEIPLKTVYSRVRNGRVKLRDAVLAIRTGEQR